MQRTTQIHLAVVGCAAALTHLGIDPDPPTIARARDPTDDAA
jgi:hypothetical protein